MERLTHTFKDTGRFRKTEATPTRVSIWLLLLPFITLGSTLTLPSQTAIVQAQALESQGFSIKADNQEADRKSQIVTARGNVRINYPSQKVQARADSARYYIKQKRLVLTGDVLVAQDGKALQGESIIYLVDEGKFITNPKVK